MLQSRIRFTRSRKEPVGFARAHICISDADKPEFEEVSYSEPYPVRRFLVVDYERNLIWWREPVWQELTPEEFARDWPQVAALTREVAADALEGATLDQLASLDLLDLQPLLESKKQSVRLQAIRALARVAPEMRIEERGMVVNFPALGGAR